MKRSVLLFMIVSAICILAGPLKGQVIQMPDSLFINVPYGENFQSIEMEYNAQKDSFFLYTAFDLNSYGVVNVYRMSKPEKPPKVTLSRTFKLPYLCRHANDIQVIGDTLLVTGTNNDSISVLGLFNKNTGALYSMIIDTMASGWAVWASYIYQDTLYQIIAKDLIVELQQYKDSAFTTILQLRPSPMRDKYNYIQGCSIILGRILAILTSSPTRIDFIDLQDNYKYLGRYFGEDGGLESEGLSYHSKNDTTYIYYGLRFPNKIKLAKFYNNVSPPQTMFPEQGSIVSATILSFSWKTVPSAFTYEINIAFDSSFKSIARMDTNLVNSVYITQLPGSGPYYWRTKAKNIFSSSEWSSPNKVILDVLDSSEKWNERNLPSTFTVWQNYPNPFNSSTKITYSVPSADYIRMNLYDISGRIVKKIINRIDLPGVYSVMIDGNDLATGTYYCVIQALNNTKVLKIVLLK